MWGTYTGNDGPHGLNETALVIYKLRCLPGEYLSETNCMKCPASTENSYGGATLSFACRGCPTHYFMEGQIGCAYALEIRQTQIRFESEDSRHGISIISIENTEYITLSSATANSKGIGIVRRISQAGNAYWTLPIKWF